MSMYLLKRINFLLLIIIASCFGQNNEPTGKLSVNLVQNGIVYIDSDLIADSSFSDLSLKPGDYTLLVFNSDTRKWTQRGYEKKISIAEGENLQLTIDFNDYYYVNSTPYNAEIYQNDKHLGTTPAYIENPMIGETNKIELLKDGFNSKEIFLSPDKHNYFTKLMESSNNTTPQIAKPVLNNSQASWYREGLVALSLISSWGAFYLKREADQRYNKYMSTGNPALMDKYFNDSRRFDSYSEISLGVSVAALGTYMYFLIFE